MKQQLTHTKMTNSTLTIGSKIKGLEVVGVKGIKHGKSFPNTNIIERIALKGKRGGKYYGQVFKSGTVSIERGDYGYFEGYGVINGQG